MKNSCPQQIRQPRLDVEARGIAKKNRLIAKARWEAKKNKIRNGIPLPSEPFPTLVDLPKFSELLAGSNADGVAGTGDGVGVLLPVAHSQHWLTEALQFGWGSYSACTEENASVGLWHRQLSFRPWQGVCRSGTAWGLGSDGGEGTHACGLYTLFRSAQDEGPSFAIGGDYRIPSTRDNGGHQLPQEETNLASAWDWQSIGAWDLGHHQVCSLGPGTLL